MITKRAGEQFRAAGMLRQELAARNIAYALKRQLPHETSYGEVPAVVYRESECGQYHGNFIGPSYKAILKRPEWNRRLQKVHSQGKVSFPKCETVRRELDSAMSSDALLMNIFCYPGVTRRRELCGLLGIEEGSTPEFGFMPRVPLLTNAAERTEVVSARAGLNTSDAKTRVTEVFGQAEESADRVRKAVAHISLWLFVALLSGAFCASYAGTIGGKQRDHVVV